MTTQSISVVVGASRGIGARIAMELAASSSAVALLGKTEHDTANLPGSIASVAKEISDAASRTGKACSVLTCRCDVRSDKDIKEALEKIMRAFGRIDILVYNPGSILWNKIKDTDLKRFDLMHSINARGLYVFVQGILPVFERQQSGRIVVISPPIYSRFVQGKTPYAMTKIAASVLVLGLGHEFRLAGSNCAITGLWPATGVESYVTTKQGADPRLLRKADVMADACLAIVNAPAGTVNGRLLLDEDFLRETGLGDDHFARYQCVPGVEPPRMMPRRLPDLTVDEERAGVGPVFNMKSKL